MAIKFDRKVQKNCGLAPWEMEHGFNSDGTKRQSPDGHYSRGQWRARNRMVFVTDDKAVRVVEARNGYRLHLFDESQTKECEAK